MVSQKSQPIRIIVEGVDMAGKSYVTHQLWRELELKYNQNIEDRLMDGCYWFSCNLNNYGEKGVQMAERYLNMLDHLEDSCIIFEKFHISSLVWAKMHEKKAPNYESVEEKLTKLGFRMIVLQVDEDTKLLEKRMTERLETYPDYIRLARDKGWYLNQQKVLLDHVKKSKMQSRIFNTSELPGNVVNNILQWLDIK